MTKASERIINTFLQTKCIEYKVAPFFLYCSSLIEFPTKIMSKKVI
ncbi:MAG: hypothetical protein LBS14_00570 [Holosporaceae bacterium]|nr:hypothetical protein [Holosporaceae bacterium]